MCAIRVGGCVEKKIYQMGTCSKKIEETKSSVGGPEKKRMRCEPENKAQPFRGGGKYRMETATANVKKSPNQGDKGGNTLISEPYMRRE